MASNPPVTPAVILDEEEEEEEEEIWEDDGNEYFSDENEDDTEDSEWQSEYYFDPEDLTEIPGEDADEENGDTTDPQIEIDIEDTEEEETTGGPKETQEKVFDFNKWASDMISIADVIDETENPESPSNGEKLSFDRGEENEHNDENRSTSEEAIDSRSTEDKEDSGEDEFIQEETPVKPLVGLKSFRYFESRVLANLLRETDDERMNSRREKFNKMKKVKAPDDPSRKPSISYIKRPDSVSKNKETDEEEEINEDQEEGMVEYTDRQWALKNAEMFLKSAGCHSRQESLKNLKVNPKDMSAKLRIFLEEGGLGAQRRDGIGKAEDAPEITPALKRQAERAMWRAIIENSKPKYPLPRFILPRHRFLRKVESELIGPGSYEHDYYEKQREKRVASMPSLFRSCTSRFPKEKWRAPGADCIADPYEKWDAACLRNKHPCRGIPFESTPCNFRYRDFYVGSGIPPNTYNIKSPMEEFLNKNKLNKPSANIPAGADVFCPKVTLPDPASRLGPGAYDVRESIVKNLGDSYNYFKGKLSKTERKKMFGFKAAFENPLWPTDNGCPGPAAYSPWEHEEWIEPNWAPFGIQDNARKSSLRIQSKMIAPDYYHYGDGYSIDKGWVPEIFGSGMTSNFVSKSPQNSTDVMHNIYKERNQALNYKLDQRRRDE